jgi:hypothetical protein
MRTSRQINSLDCDLGLFGAADYLCLHVFFWAFDDCGGVLEARHAIHEVEAFVVGSELHFKHGRHLDRQLPHARHLLQRNLKQITTYSVLPLVVE